MDGNTEVKTYPKGTKADCYKLIQEVGVARDKVCQEPSCSRPADCSHHIFKRDRLATAFHPDCVLGVCTAHHTGWCHNKPESFKQFMCKRLGEDRYYELRRLSYEHVEAIDYHEISLDLRRVLSAWRRGS